MKLRVYDKRLGTFSEWGPWIPLDKPEEFRIDRPTDLKDKNGKEIYENDNVRWVEDEYGDVLNDITTTISFHHGIFWLGEGPGSRCLAELMRGDLEIVN